MLGSVVNRHVMAKGAVQCFGNSKVQVRYFYFIMKYPLISGKFNKFTYQQQYKKLFFYVIKPKKLNIWIIKKKKKIPFIVDVLTTDKSFLENFHINEYTGYVERTFPVQTLERINTERMISLSSVPPRRKLRIFRGDRRWLDERVSWCSRKKTSSTEGSTSWIEFLVVYQINLDELLSVYPVSSSTLPVYTRGHSISPRVSAIWPPVISTRLLRRLTLMRKRQHRRNKLK